MSVVKGNVYVEGNLLVQSHSIKRSERFAFNIVSILRSIPIFESLKSDRHNESTI